MTQSKFYRAFNDTSDFRGNILKMRLDLHLKSFSKCSVCCLMLIQHNNETAVKHSFILINTTLCEHIAKESRSYFKDPIQSCVRPKNTLLGVINCV